MHSHTLSDVDLSPHTPNILATPCLLFSVPVHPCFSPSPPASSHIQSSHWRATKDSPSLLLCLTLLLQQLLLSLSLSLWVLVKYMLLALLLLRMLLLPSGPSHRALVSRTIRFSVLSLRHSFSIPSFVSYSSSVLCCLPGKEGLFPRHCSPQPLQPSIIHSLTLKSTHNPSVCVCVWVCVCACTHMCLHSSDESVWEVFRNLWTGFVARFPWRSIHTHTHTHTHRHTLTHTHM